jgi:polyhydroxyalkanoate depolymerase
LSVYALYELNHAALAPWRAVADATKMAFQSPFNPLAETEFGRSVAAAAELFERTTRRYGKPAFGITRTVVDGRDAAVSQQAVWTRPFCSLLHFKRDLPKGRPADPKVLIVAPLSGHYATLLRGTVEAMLPEHDVYITDWQDARMVPLAAGRFDLDDYIDYVIDMLAHLGPGAHVMAVCQPSVPVLAAVSLMSEADDPNLPASMTLMGGPIDTRFAPTAVNKLAKAKGIDWFERKVLMQVPFPHPGFLRWVYPGFLQLGGFMSMNLDRHVTAHQDLFRHLVAGDGDSAEKHREFYEPHRGILPPDGADGLHRPRAAERHDDPSRPPGQARRHPPHGPAHRGRGAGRHLRGGSDRGGTCPLHGLAGSQEAALFAAHGRALRRVQRLPFPQRDRAADQRFHPQPRQRGGEAPPSSKAAGEGGERVAASRGVDRRIFLESPLAVLM